MVLVINGGLWFRVLAAHYGVEGRRLNERGQGGSSWWREIVKICDGVGGVGGSSFDDCISNKVGDRLNTYFWIDPWLGGTPLCVRFRRLFNLAGNKSSTVADLFSLGCVEGGGAWNWRRRLWAWEEEMLGECTTLLHDIILHTHS
jgi:hypothetical protein